MSRVTRIDSSFILNVPLAANTMSDVRDDPYFQTNHTEQLLEALNLLVKHCALRGRNMLCVVNEGQLKPFYIRRGTKHLFYRDPLIKSFVDYWVTLDEVDRTFFLIDSENNYDEELRMQCMYDCLLYTSPSPRDQRGSRMPSSA